MNNAFIENLTTLSYMATFKKVSCQIRVKSQVLSKISYF